MPEHNPEDRVFIKNVIKLEEDDIKTFWITRYKKVSFVNANGLADSREITEEKEIEWNFKDGFFFAWGGKHYVIKPGESMSYPRYLADHCVKHMIDYILNTRYLATKRTGEDGTPRYDTNILQNDVLRKKLRNEIFQGVEEWYSGSGDDFDTILNKKYGGDFVSASKESVNMDSQDYEMPEIEQDSPISAIKESVIPPTSDPQLQNIREEADLNNVTYTERDTVSSIKAKIIKTMA